MDPQAQPPVSFLAMRETNREWTLINANRVGLKEGLTEDRKDSEGQMEQEITEGTEESITYVFSVDSAVSC